MPDPLGSGIFFVKDSKKSKAGHLREILLTNYLILFS